MKETFNSIWRTEKFKTKKSRKNSKKKLPGKPHINIFSISAYRKLEKIHLKVFSNN
jgi:hypothetical protein